MAEPQPHSFGCGTAPRARKGRAAHLSFAVITRVRRVLPRKRMRNNQSLIHRREVAAGAICATFYFLNPAL